MAARAAHDGGKIWPAMPGCDAVFTASAGADHALYGVMTHKDSKATDVVRSTDAGAAWQNLTVTRPLTPGVTDGGREATWVRVHPKTRFLWVATSCYGLWKIAPPPAARHPDP